MANALGGYIIIGVEDGTLKIVGLTDTGAALDTILRAARQVQPGLALTPPEPEIYLIEGKKVVVATIPASLGPVY
jgi:predicted HTH transcriptional regulator